MMRTLFKAGLLLATVAICTDAGASQRRSSPDLSRPNVTIDGPITSPGETFYPTGLPMPHAGDIAVNPWKMACFVDPTLYGPEGQAYLGFKNTGTEVIPAGSWYEFTLSNGVVKKYKMTIDLKPGDAFYAYVPDEVTELGFDCKVHVVTA